MNLSLLSRYAFFACIALFTLLSLPFLGSTEWLWPFTLLGVALSLLGLFDLIQTPPRGAPQLSDPGQHPLSGGRHPPGDPPVPAGSRRRRPALLPRPALAGLLAGEERKLGEALRHP
ncbi:glutamate synthase [Pseudomonas aeruginosa]|nr:glutamate synthase [Pseudomonas aeruginosa]